MHRTRRSFLKQSAGIALGAAALPLAPDALLAADSRADRMRFGLVTYLWGRDWKLPQLIANCATADVLGVELRTTHAHGVEPSLSKDARKEIRKRFADSPVALVGIGSNERYDSPKPEVLRKAIEATKEFIVLSHDVGGSGVKVKPDSFHKDVPREKTIAQIGESLVELGKFAADYEQEIRLEVHGGCSHLPTIAAIMTVAKHPNVRVCWNSNAQDLEGKGLDHNFHLVRKRFGATAHVRELGNPKYPYGRLTELLVATKYRGWVLLEARGAPKDRVAALRDQKALFDKLVAAAEAKMKTEKAKKTKKAPAPKKS